MKSYFLISTLILILTACGSEHSDVSSNDLGAVSLSTYEMLDKELFKPRCSTCHTSFHFSGVDTSSYEGLINSGVIVAGDSERSILVESIASGFMPERGERIKTDDDIFLLLELWIQNGALKTD